MTSSPYEYRTDPPAGIVRTVRTASWVVWSGSGGDPSGCGLMRRASSDTSTGTSAELLTSIPTGRVTVSPLRSYVSFTTVTVTRPRPAASQRLMDSGESDRIGERNIGATPATTTAPTRRRTAALMEEKSRIRPRMSDNRKICRGVRLSVPTQFSLVPLRDYQS